MRCRWREGELGIVVAWLSAQHCTNQNLRQPPCNCAFGQLSYFHRYCAVSLRRFTARGGEACIETCKTRPKRQRKMCLFYDCYCLR